MCADGPRIEAEDPRSPRAQRDLEAYVREVREAAGLTELEVSGGLADVHGFLPDHGGAFFIVNDGADAIGCVGLRKWEDGIGEIKRMWVAPAARGQGLGTLMLEQVERTARDLGYHRLVLDTNSALTAALRFYAGNGFREIERYNQNRDATHFFAKDLGR